MLLRHPFYTFITLFGISLTLTVLMVLTSFVDHLVGSHYPETRRDRSLYIDQMVQTDSGRTSSSSGPLSFKFLTEYAKSLKTPERVSVFSTMSSSNAYVGTQKVKLTSKFTDADFWEVTKFDFLEGKPYTQQNVANGDFVAVITDGFKKQYFDEPTESVVGKPIEIENITYKVIGVVRGSPITRLFSYADVYFPYTTPKSNYQNAGFRGDYQAIVLTKKPEDLAAVRAEFQDRIRRIPVPGVENGFKYALVDVRSESYWGFFLGILSGNNAARLALFYGVVGFLLLMIMGLPAINLVNLNVSRILERSSEIGIRKAFGAPVRTLLWQFILENVFITFIGGAIALVISIIVIQLINRSGLILYADLTVNGSVLAVSMLVCLVFGLLSGVLPALRMSKLTIADALKS